MIKASLSLLGRIPLGIIGTVTGILVIGLLVSFMVHIPDWVQPCSNRMN